MQPLLIRPIPIQDEHLKSYLIRLAESNQLTGLFHLLNAVELVRGRQPVNLTLITDSNISPERLSKLSAISENDLIGLTFYDVFGKYLNERKGEVNTVFRFGLKTKYNQMCPLCMQENPYLRKRWDIGLHRCLMVNKCPNCGKNLSLNFPSVFICKCGYDLRTSPVLYVSKDETSLSTLIASKLDRKTVDGEDANNLLSRLELLSSELKGIIK